MRPWKRLAAPALAGLVLLTGCAGESTPASPAPVPTPPSATPEPPPPPPPCVSLAVEFQSGDTTHRIARGELVLEALDPEIALDFARPYTIEVPAGGANLDVPGLRTTIGVFVSDLAFMPLAAGFRQTMTIEWISELEVRAGGPDCEPVAVSCDLAGCAGS